jgi:hypothetical protein
MLTFENDSDGSLEVSFDDEGLADLLSIIDRARRDDHEWAATPSWGGNELTEEFHPEWRPIHQVTFRYRPAGGQAMSDIRQR